MSETQMTKKTGYLDNGEPRYVRCYDNGGETADRYTVVFTKIGHKKGLRGVCMYLGMSSDPLHPQGIGQHGESDKPIDRPGYSHLGKKISFSEMTPEARVCTMRTYRDLWP